MEIKNFKLKKKLNSKCSKLKTKIYITNVAATCCLNMKYGVGLANTELSQI